LVSGTLRVCEAGMVFRQPKVDEKESVNWQTGEQPGMSEFCALGKTSDPETILPSALFLLKMKNKLSSIRQENNRKPISKIYLTGFCLILALPLLSLPPLFDPPDWGKTIIFRIIVSVLALLFGYQILFKKIVIDFCFNWHKSADREFYCLLPYSSATGCLRRSPSISTTACGALLIAPAEWSIFFSCLPMRH